MPLIEWNKTQPSAFLSVFGVDANQIADRHFMPRLLLGAYFRDELDQLSSVGIGKGHRIRLRENTRVIDGELSGADVRLTDRTGGDPELFDHVVLASGHDWPDDDGKFRIMPSHWSGLIDQPVPAGRTGILGSSLSGTRRFHGGALMSGESGGWTPRIPVAARLAITLMARTGILPEADFYCPLPYLYLEVFTPAAVTAEIASGPDGMLDRLFTLFVAQLRYSDPDYLTQLQETGLLTADTINAACFAPRRASDPFLWAKGNLQAAEADQTARHIVPWRYAILRMHMVFEPAVPLLDRIRPV